MGDNVDKKGLRVIGSDKPPSTRPASPSLAEEGRRETRLARPVSFRSSSTNRASRKRAFDSPSGSCSGRFRNFRRDKRRDLARPAPVSVFSVSDWLRRPSSSRSCWTLFSSQCRRALCSLCCTELNDFERWSRSHFILVSWAWIGHSLRNGITGKQRNCTTRH